MDIPSRTERNQGTTQDAARDSATVLADTSAAGQTGHVRAADQAIETGIDRAAGAGETKIWWLGAGAARATVAGAAARTVVAPVAIAGACGTPVGAAAAALRARGADTPAAGRAGTARTADQAATAGMFGAGCAATTLVRAVMPGC